MKKFGFTSRIAALGVFLLGLMSFSASAVVLWSPSNGDINVPAIAANGTMTGGSAATFGALTATTINGNTFTTGTGTLTLAAGKTLTASNTLRFAGTDSTVMTFPTTSATIARTDAANTFTGTQTVRAAATQDSMALAGRAGGSGSFVVTLSPTTLTASRAVTFPDAATTIPVATQVLTFSGPTAARTITLPDAAFTAARTDAAQTFTGVQTFTSPFVGTAPVTTTCPSAHTYSVAATDMYLIVNDSATCTLTLPTASTNTGRALTVKTIAAFTVVSNASNVAPSTSASAGTAILAGTAGKFAKMISDGTNWIVMEAN